MAILTSAIKDYINSIITISSTPIRNFSKSEKKVQSFNVLNTLSKLLFISSHKFYLQLANFSCKYAPQYLNTIGYLKQISKNSLKSKDVSVLIEVSVNLMNIVDDYTVPNKLKSVFSAVVLVSPVNEIEKLNKIINDLTVCESIYMQAFGLRTENKDFPEFGHEDMCLTMEEVQPLVKNFYHDRCYDGEEYSRKLADLLIQRKGLRTALHLLMNAQCIARPGEIKSLLSQIFENITNSRYIDHEQCLNLMIELKDSELFTDFPSMVLDRFNDFSTLQTLC